MASWTLEVQTDENGDAYIVFPQEAMEEVGWQVGDDIRWIDNKDGTYTLELVE